MRSILGILGKALVVVLVSTLTVTGISAYQLSQELGRRQITLTGLDGKEVKIPDLKGPLNILLVGS
ncbi:MAG: hypothetical protein RLZZ556_383, partial [Actinomycetota bacterium]